MESCGFDTSRLRENYEKEMGVWMKLAQKGGEEIRPGDKLTGNVLPADYFERIGFGNGFDGIVWVQKEIDVPAEDAGKPMTLKLGAIDDEDVTYLNGVDFSSLPTIPNPAARSAVQAIRQVERNRTETPNPKCLSNYLINKQYTK